MLTSQHSFSWQVDTNSRAALETAMNRLARTFFGRGAQGERQAKPPLRKVGHARQVEEPGLPKISEQDRS